MSAETADYGGRAAGEDQPGSGWRNGPGPAAIRAGRTASAAAVGAWAWAWAGVAAGAAVPRPAPERAEPPVTLAEMVVTPSRYGVAEERTTTAATLTAAEIEALPQLGEDLYRSIARLPGLAADDFTAQFWVRGAPYGELKVRLDGVDLVEPFHLKDVDGALSIVDPQTLGRLDLTTAGFTAEFGDRLAGVLTMETKTAQRPETSLGLSLTGVTARHLGAARDGRAGWLVAARRGYPDIALRAAGRDDELYPRYYDATAKFEYRPAAGHTVTVQALQAGDTLRYRRTDDPTLQSSYDSTYLWTRWQARFGRGAEMETVVAGTRLAWERRGGGRLDGFPFELRDERALDRWTLRHDWTVPVHERALLRGGVEAATGEADYDYAVARRYSAVAGGAQTTVPVTRAARFGADGTAWGGFAAARVRPLEPLTIEPGIRYDRQDWTGDRTWTPRLNAAWAAGRSTVRLAWGEYAQSQGLHEVAVADGETAFRRAERAEHRVIGWERPLGRGLALRLEAYERRSWDLRPRWENVDHPYDIFPEAKPDRLRLDPKEGRARGVEPMVSGRPRPNLTWNASYARAEARERIGGQWVRRAREQRHTVQLDATYAPDRKWQFSAAWQYHTGWPTTELAYTLATLANGRRVLTTDYGPVYGSSLPDYHRLDLRATRRIALRRGELRVFVDVFNAYDRTNYVGFLHRATVTGTTVATTKRPREQLPVLPSAGVAWEF